ncbi:amidohydrolase family protein [Nissabacter archeti]|uniref:Amidohydrolase family protein n=1 Tax=Nissabacter archeti TaxID=1917880 RepID=A0ABS5JN75_9GAMM|nr:amidohydrolase family protein [Nissabacter archeti]MBS0971440.1 amidohydrolase family protein [Nissabacter archeti]
MRIDAHQHFWRYQPQEYGWISDQMAVLQRDFLPGDLLPLLQQQRIDGCIAVQARQSLDETLSLLAMADANPFIRGVVGWLPLTSPALAEVLAPLQDRPALRGVRHLVQDESDPAAWLQQPALAGGMQRIQSRGYVYELLVTHRHLADATTFAARHDDHWLVLDHLGKPDIARGAAHWARQIAPLAALPHVACKLSGLITEAPGFRWTPALLQPFIDAALEAFGPDRLLAGSDWPVCLLAGEYADVTDLCEQALTTLSDAERAAILGGNACRLYGLQEPDYAPQPH